MSRGRRDLCRARRAADRARRPAAARPRPSPTTPSWRRAFAEAEAAEAEGRYAEAADLYRRCLALDPATRSSPFNRANCLRAAGRQAEAAHDYTRAIKLDPGFVEAWFNLAGLIAERGHAEPRAATSRRRSRSTPTMPTPSSISPSSNSTPAISPRRGAAGRAISSSTDESEWARTAARGIQFVDLAAAVSGTRGLRWCERFPVRRPATDATRHHPACAWRRRADGFRVDDRDGQGARRRRFARRPFRVRLHGGRRTTEGRKPPPRAETLIPEYRAAVAELDAQRPARHRRQVDGRPGRQHGGRRAPRCRQDRRARLPRLPVSSAGQAGAAPYQASRRSCGRRR